MNRIVLLILVAAVAATGGWIVAKRSARPDTTENPATARKVAFYQSPMHPWIKSEDPGNCTICGMKLMPVYEGEKGFGSDTAGVITLGSNIIQVINVQTEEVKKQKVVRTLRVAGTIEEDDTRHRRLSAYVDGRVEKLFVNFVGAEVVAGEPLAALYSPVLLTAESEYLTVLRQRPATNTAATLQREHERVLAAAAERLKRLGYSDAQVAALSQKDHATAQVQVLAPISGTVVTRNVYEGQYVKEGDVLFELADFSRMWFQFEAYEQDLAWLRIGQPVEITSPSAPGKSLTAPIVFIEPNLNDMTRSVRVRVVLENPLVVEGSRQRAFLNRTYADGRVKVELPETIAVSRTAILAGGAEALAYVDLGGGAYEQRKLKLGRRGDDLVEVINGLQEGEQVVTTGNLLIDSQAQLNAGVSTADAMSGSEADDNIQKSSKTLDSMTEEQKRRAQEFLSLTSELGAALAADDLKQFNATAPRLHAEVPGLIEAFAAVTSLRPALQRLEKASHLEAARDLALARRQFLPFSMATVDLARQWRKFEPFTATRIYNCPMVNQAIPGAARNGQWIQLTPPLRNPYFGAEMLECGTEVKP